MEKPWLKSYPFGIPTEVNVHRYENLVEFFDSCVQQFGNFPAFTHLNVNLTYQQLQKKAQRFAQFLLENLKLKKGDRVALMLPNILQYPIAMLGTLYAGCVVVNVNPMYTADELVHQLQDAEVSAIVVLENFASVLAEAMKTVLVPSVIVTEFGDALGAIESRIINFLVKRVKKLVLPWEIQNFFSWHTIFGNHSFRTASSALAGESGVTLEDQEKPWKNPEKMTSSDLAFLQYTGGTTGLAKGAELTHGNLLANIEQSITWMKPVLKSGKEVVTAALPLYHIFSLTVCCFCFLSIGGNCLLISDPRDLNHFIKTLHHHPVSVFIGLNTLFHALLDHPHFKEIDFSRLKLTIAGGMPTHKIIADRWQEKTGVLVLEGYGLTEASPIVSINPLNAKCFTGSIGLPIPNTEIMLRDLDGQASVPHEAGELCVRGPQVMRGYWRNAKETQTVLDSEGWLATGDIARMDEDGFLYIVDRKKDMILVSGFKVFPNQIEEALLQNPDIAEAAVVGVPSEKTGEAVKAFIVRRNPNLSADQIIAFCHQHLTGYKIPKLIEFRDSLPKSNVGKILRRKLK